METIGEQVVSCVVDNILTQVLGLKDEFQGVGGVPDEIKMLSCTLRTIQAYVNDAEERQSTEMSVKLWLKDVKDIAYEAEDIIDEFVTKQRLKQMEEEENPAPPLWKKVCRGLSSPVSYIQEFYSRYDFQGRTKKVNEEIEKILNLRSQLNLSARGGDANSISRVEQRPPTGPFVIEPKIYGRDVDKQNIMSMLLSGLGGYSGCSSSGVVAEHHLCVVVIVGMGGLGKTTLAQLVYNEVHEQFDKKIWICVSEDFVVTRIIQSILESITGCRCELSQMDLLQSRLQDALHGKKYLLVLDDVWNEKSLKWDMVIGPLRLCGVSGSMVLVTTRSVKVAHAMHIRDPYILKGLSNDDCWSLFQQTAFANSREVEEFPKLVEIGKEIVKNYCKGVPLAAKALGGILFSYREESYWLYIKEAGISSLSNDDQGTLSILRLSYNHLPPYLKQCFVYCSLFPKDTEIVVDDLIHKWMAHSFIHPSGRRSLEDIGYGYFNELFWRSFFQDLTKDKFIDMKTCKMHDLVHDLAQSIAGDEYSIVTWSNSKNCGDSIQARHLTISNDMIPSTFHELKDLHTFSYACSYVSIPVVVLDRMFSRMKYLRVLDLSMASISSLPNSICNLIHLRCFNLGGIQNGILPNSMCNLLNLQTLEVKTEVSELPKDISRLNRLRFLEFKVSYNLKCMPPMFRQLTCLRRLRGFVVTKNEGCGLDELGGLDHLEGSLEIYKLENVRNGGEARQAKLKNKHNLKWLNLSWSSQPPIENTEQVLEGLHPHQNLKRLTISSYPGQHFPSWLMGSWLSNLVQLNLSHCNRCELLPPLLEFSSLEDVFIQEVTSAKYLKFSICGCSCLKTLSLSCMHNLESVLQTDGDHSFWPLKKLWISKCLRLTSLSLVKSLCLEFLEILNCPRLSCLPIISLRNLKLVHCNFRILTSIRSLTSLAFLKIEGFTELECLPDRLLHSHSLLAKLVIEHCPNLIDLGDVNNPPALKCLELYGCKKLDKLPQWLQNLTCINELVLGKLGSGFTTLPEWLEYLTSLRSLRIHDLEHVTCLPTGLLHLPLQHLEIRKSPRLMERYDRTTGIDKDKIQHIPSVSFITL